ncbi:hypothetical protein NOG67_06325 [Erwinia persicina]|uniref:hypothetical protein n=1 Tax=Erwinia persicina TaxID=55211 RepID=UPI002103D0C5|nr:hypothetical protein [Erwinia persicina]MCQ4104440.1 hypothetical protein [Erwinia persicina]UTX14101.1 hypothetical protein NOG67_06325 [Erwinia persicina]
MNKLITCLIFLFGMLVANVYAQDMVFKCSASNNRKISVYQDGDILTYKFGKDSSKPDIEIKRGLQKLNIIKEVPVGTGLNSSVEFKNGIYSYTINESLNRVSEEHESTAWLDVQKNGDVISSIYCNVDNGSLSDIDTNYK